MGSAPAAEPAAADVRPSLATAPAMMPLFVGGATASGVNDSAASQGAGAPASAGTAQRAVGLDAGAPALAHAPTVSDEMGEKADAKVKRRPYTPSPKEVEEHEATHYPYRAWCRHCVAGAGRLDGHAAVCEKLRDQDCDTIAVDYGYFNDISKDTTEDAAAKEETLPDHAAENQDKDDQEKHKTHTPIIFATDRRFGSVFAAVVPEKGVNTHAVGALREYVLGLGLTRVKLRSDGERPVRALLDQVSAEIRRKGVEVVPDQTPKGDSQAACLQESTVHRVKCKARTLWHHARELHEIDPGDAHVAAIWCVQYAAKLINRTHKGDDGRTAWSRITGRREFPRPVAPWGEKVMYAMGGHKHKPGVETKWGEGIFLDLVELTGEYVIGTPAGMVKSGCIKRMIRDEARDPALFKAVVGQPWRLSPTSAQGTSTVDLPTRLSVQPAVPESDLPGLLGRAAEALPRRLYIRREVELARYGKTEGCQGCLAAHLGAKAVMHNEACRTRITARVEADCGEGAKRPRRDAGATALAGTGDPMGAGAPALSEGTGGDAGAPAPPGTGEDQPMETETADTPMDAGAPAPLSRSRDAGAPAPAGAAEAKRPRVDQDSSMEEFYNLFELSLDGPEDEELLELTSKSVDVAEIFCPPRFTERAGRHKLNPGLALDLRTGWDLNDPKHIAAMWRYLDKAKPMLVVGSPECGPFSKLASLNKGKPAYAKTLRDGLAHLRLMCRVYEYQVAQGRLFLHEHPDGASSWGTGAMQRILALPEVLRVYVDQCMYGQEVTSKGRTGLAMKPTGFATNSRRIAERLQVRCDRSHEHIVLMGGIARQAAAYPPRLVDTVLVALKQELEDLGQLNAMDGGGPTADEPSLEEEWAETFYDEVSGALLDPALVKQARKLEVDYMHQLKVYEEASLEEWQASGCRLIPMRWLDINKGDSETVNIRSRAVLQETRRRSDLGPNDIASTFAAAPPLEGLRMMVSLAMSGQQGVPLKDRKVLAFYDVSRAHFHSPAKRLMFVKTLPEDTYIRSGIAKMLKAMYGSRDAGRCWDDFSDTAMKALTFKAGDFCPCVYYSEELDAPCWRHGDDFVVLATRTVLATFFESAQEHMILKHMGTLGPCKDVGDVSEVRCLNRLLRYVSPAYKSADEGYIEWEPDPRHLEILMSENGIRKDSKCLGQPCVKREQGSDETVLNETDKFKYRSSTMRLAYLAQDRVDVQYCSKELARAMQAPTVWDKQQLQRAVRYLHGAGRIVQRFKQQAMPEGLVTFTDSDFAGCTRTRKSTGCTMVFWGEHLIKSSSTTQGVIALSSGEAEFYSAVKGASVSLGVVSLFRDLGITMKGPATLRVDSTACLGMAGRRGAGKVRHLHTPTLWLQQAVADGRIVVEKEPGTSNPADLGTKPLPKAAIQRILERCGFTALAGRSNLALRAAV